MDSNDSNSLIPNTKIEMKSKPKVRKISPEEFEKNRIIKAWLKDLERAKYRVQQLE